MEFIASRRFDNLKQLLLELADAVHWFNHIRLHGTLGYLSPDKFRSVYNVSFLFVELLTIHSIPLQKVEK